MIGITNAKYLGEYRINVSFNNGESGDADLQEFIYNDQRPVFKALKNRDAFKEFKVECNILMWNSGADLAPEFVYFLIFKDNQSLQEKFKRWGYITSPSCLSTP